MKITVYVDHLMTWRWRLTDAERPLAVAPQGYGSERECLEAISHLRSGLPQAEVVDRRGRPVGFAGNGHGQAAH